MHCNSDSIAQCPNAGRPSAPRARHAGNEYLRRRRPGPLPLSRSSKLFIHDPAFEGLVGHDPFEASVVVLESTELSHLGDLHARAPGVPAAVVAQGKAATPEQLALGGRRSCVFQDRDIYSSVYRFTVAGQWILSTVEVSRGLASQAASSSGGQGHTNNRTRCKGVRLHSFHCRSILDACPLQQCRQALTASTSRDHGLEET